MLKIDRTEVEVSLQRPEIIGPGLKHSALHELPLFDDDSTAPLRFEVPRSSWGQIVRGPLVVVQIEETLESFRPSRGAPYRGEERHKAITQRCGGSERHSHIMPVRESIAERLNAKA
ncbi:hypothetical protein [Curtobacterium aetherium]|uniref:Uncharacterized protein n=1 Tax=Curtobacterium aetherium TaxID=2841594 RepID=A0ACD1E7I6_9MICO|nr:hypothetical protein [Curtobacterium sp. L6-1]QWS34917.1 hypothetical protein KM842_07280 [Curtobacterium sp. L6-1]